MKVFLVIVLIVVIGLFVWQVALFVRDIIRKIKQKKLKNAVNKSVDEHKSAENDSARKE